MEEIILHHEALGVFFARLFLGLLFFFQGYDAVFKVKIENVIATFETSFARKGIPRFMTVIGAWFTSYVELLGGLLLIFGLFEYYTLFFLGINLIVASIAFGITTPMWDTRHVYPRLVILVFLLIMPHSIDILSLDNLLFK